MSLMDHLRELRNRAGKAAIAAGLAMIVVYLFYSHVYDFVTDPYCSAIARTEQNSCDLFFFSPLEGFMLRLRVAGYGGIAMALPVILWQLWRFIAPGLYSKEKKYAVGFVFVSTLLFALGGVLAYYTLPEMFVWLVNAQGGGVLQSRGEDYFSLFTLLVLAFGVAFEFPLFLVALQAIGVVKPEQLTKYRRHAIVGIVIVVAAITPGGDPISLAALAGPLYLFYEISILVGKLIRRRKKAPA